MVKAALVIKAETHSLTYRAGDREFKYTSNERRGPLGAQESFTKELKPPGLNSFTIGTTLRKRREHRVSGLRL